MKLAHIVYSEGECGSSWHSRQPHVRPQLRLREHHHVRHVQVPRHRQEVFYCVLFALLKNITDCVQVYLIWWNNTTDFLGQ